jgi:SAM-dependent methyltransferase
MITRVKRALRSRVARAQTAFSSSRGPFWYHDFSAVGVPTRQIDNTYQAAQALKTPQFNEMVRRAFSALSRSDLSQMHGVELFCADAYFSQLLLARGVGEMTGFDTAEDSPEGRNNVLSQAAFIARRLGNSGQLELRKADVFSLSGTYDFAVNFGGLYHLENPLNLLRLIRRSVTGPMFLQTIVSLKETGPDYFETPAPGWTWGSRFSERRLAEMIREAGYRTEYWSFTLASYNKRLDDRGCVFALCVPE